MIINTYGDRSDPVVIILHPMGFSGSQFYEQLGPHFRGKYFFVAPDMGNHGKELREFHSIEAEMSQLYIWLVKNDLRDITLLYGASMGAAGALHLFQHQDLQFQRIYLDGAPVARLGLLMRSIFGPVLIWTRNSMRKNMENANAEYMERYGEKMGREMGESFLKFSDASIQHIAQACVSGNTFPISEENEASITFDWGSKELYTKTSMPLVKKLYPKARVIIREGYQHCEYLAKHPEDYVTGIEGLLL